MDEEVSYFEAGLALAAESKLIDNDEENIAFTPIQSHKVAFLLGND